MGVVLTKDNLVTRNYNGSKKCMFCMQNKTINHLFFDWFMWHTIHFTFGINIPTSIHHTCDEWSLSIDSKLKTRILVGIVALWMSRNDVVFGKCSVKSYMQVIFIGTYWRRQWVMLRRCDRGGHRAGKGGMPSIGNDCQCKYSPNMDGILVIDLCSNNVFVKTLFTFVS
jgi:hypothetical protein